MLHGEVGATAGRPYYGIGYHKPFPIKIGATLDWARAAMHRWIFAIYPELTSLSCIGILGVTQKTTWFMLHQIREAWSGLEETFDGLVGADESYKGGHRANMFNYRRQWIAIRRHSIEVPRSDHQ